MKGVDWQTGLVHLTGEKRTISTNLASNYLKPNYTIQAVGSYLWVFNVMRLKSNSHL